MAQRSAAGARAWRAGSLDPSTTDPSSEHPAVLSDKKINSFDYQERDADGRAVPRAAHIRKSYPRDQAQPGHDEANRHRILRRGIPYGPELQPTEPAYPGDGPVPDNQDRGLLFLCYQSSVSRGFEFIQTQWINNTDFPAAGDGNDPIASQNVASAPFGLPPTNPHLAIARWVVTTGGDYFFSPSVSAVAALATPAP